MSAPDLFAFLDSERERVSAGIERFLAEKGAQFDAVSGLGSDMCRRLAEFAVKGKLIRGSLVGVGARSGRLASPEDVTATGVAMELFQTALLVHDDIMDRDTERRGGASIHHQYETRAIQEGLRDPNHYGCALGMCVGDVAFFAAFEALSRLAADPASVREVLRLFAAELAAVGVAQAQDVRNGALGIGADAPGLEVADVERLYLYKTGRYTFSLPLCAGALLAGASPGIRASLERTGEALGVVFQIKDDEIGLFGDPDHTGKPAGSDVREGKKTIYYLELMRLAGAEERRRAASIFGAEEASPEDVETIRRLTEKTGARDAVTGRMERHADQGRSEIRRLEKDAPEVASLLGQLLDYSLTRTS